MKNQFRRIKFIWLLAVVVCFGPKSFAQTKKPDSIYFNLPCLKIELNKIENDSVALKSFYKKLHRLKNDSVQKVSIVHIGDSHIQADYFSGKVRQNLQSEFGNAGRGLIFPYKLAKTNGQESFKSSSNVEWESKRCVFPDLPLPTGISGITIKSTVANAELKIMLSNENGLHYGTNKITLFHEKGPNTFDFLVYDNDNHIQGFINSNIKGDYSFTSKIDLDTFLNQFIIKAYRKDSFQTYAQIYGLLLENKSRGILYNTIGVNGAEFRHYNLSNKFIEQLPALKPDLVIISLGTNDAFRKGFNPTLFASNIDLLVKSIQKNNPKANILLTTPSDSYRKKGKSKADNPDIKLARNIMVDYCLKNNIAYWDLYEIMGGVGSIKKWKAKGLVQPDLLHFTKSGYELQAKLLYNALINGFKKSELNGLQ